MWRKRPTDGTLDRFHQVDSLLVPIEVHERALNLPSYDVCGYHALILENYAERQATLHTSICRLLHPNSHIGTVASLEDTPGDLGLLFRRSPKQDSEESIKGSHYGPYHRRHCSH